MHLFGSVTFNTGSSVQRLNLLLSGKPDLSFSKRHSPSAKLGGEGDSGKATLVGVGKPLYTTCLEGREDAFHPLL